jgi:RNA polymerase sigma factor (TIGR02999 family)
MLVFAQALDDGRGRSRSILRPMAGADSKHRNNEGDVTRRLNALQRPPEGNTPQLPAEVYRQLRQLAHGQLRREHANQTLSTTALVHEAWLRMEGCGDWADRSHFYRYAATAMRHILVDEARRRLSEKRGGGVRPTELSESDVHAEDAAADILSLNHALESLELEYPQLSKVVELRFFAGLSVGDTAEIMDISERSVIRNWRMARAMIHCALDQDHGV